MPTGLFQELHEALSNPRDPLYSVNDIDILATFYSLAYMRSLRFGEDGSRRSAAVSRIATREIGELHGLLPAQVIRIAEIFDRHRVADICARAVRTISSVGGSAVGHGPFIAPLNQHCGRVLRYQSSIDVLCAERSSCFRTSMIVLECPQCLDLFYLNKRVAPDFFAGERWKHHIFYAFDSGHPTHISNRSGSVVIATDLVHDFATRQSMLRCELHRQWTRLALKNGIVRMKGVVVGYPAWQINVHTGIDIASDLTSCTHVQAGSRPSPEKHSSANFTHF